MSVRPYRVAGLVLLSAAAARAEKLPAGFKAELEQTFRPKFTFAVVMQDGVPTTSVYGVNGEQTASHYSVDVVNGRWKESEGLLDSDQTMADFLGRGEVMELASTSWKDNRVDLRMVSVEAHKVTRGSWPLKTTKREPVATNFKFFFPFRVTSAQDAPRAIEYIESYLKAFPGESEARAFAARVVAGPETAGAAGTRRDQGSPRAAAAAGPTGASTSKKEIKAGMTPLEVLDILGKPQKELTFENRSRWTYPDLTVVFENGRVKEVKF